MKYLHIAKVHFKNSQVRGKRKKNDKANWFSWHKSVRNKLPQTETVSHLLTKEIIHKSLPMYDVDLESNMTVIILFFKLITVEINW